MQGCQGRVLSMQRHPATQPRTAAGLTRGGARPTGANTRAPAQQHAAMHRSHVAVLRLITPLGTLLPGAGRRGLVVGLRAIECALHRSGVAGRAAGLSARAACRAGVLWGGAARAGPAGPSPSLAHVQRVSREKMRCPRPARSPQPSSGGEEGNATRGLQQRIHAAPPRATHLDHRVAVPPALLAGRRLPVDRLVHVVAVVARNERHRGACA